MQVYAEVGSLREHGVGGQSGQGARRPSGEQGEAWTTSESALPRPSWLEAARGRGMGKSPSPTQLTLPVSVSSLPLRNAQNRPDGPMGNSSPDVFTLT